MLLVISVGVGAVLAAGLALAQVRGEALLTLPSLDLAALAIVGGFGLTLLRRPSEARAARVADRQAGLQNRLATAWEILDGRMHGELAGLQLAETWHACRAVGPRRALPVFTHTLRNVAVTVVVVTLFASIAMVRADDMWSALDSLSQLHPPNTEQLARTSEQPASLPQPSSPVAVTSPAADDTAAITNARLREQLQLEAAQTRSLAAAVAKLADALKGTAAAADVGASLERQDYAAAAGQLRDLARESDQLSTASKQELARALFQASKDSASLDQALVVAEQDAARALGRRDYTAGRSAVENLAQVLSTTRQRPSSASPGLLQQPQSQDGTPSANNSSCAGGDEYAPVVDCTQGALYTTGAMHSISQTTDVPSPVAGTGDLGRGGGYAAGGSGTSPVGDIVTRIASVGDNVVQVDLTPSGAQGRGGPPDPKAATTLISQADQHDVVQPGLPQPSQPIVDVAETTVVPPALGPTVRGYFQPTRLAR